MQLNKDLRGMSVLSRTSRVLVALALFLSVNAPLMLYACGATGQTLTTSTIAVETTGPDAVPCGIISGGVHDRVCGKSHSAPVCDDTCTTDIIERQLVVHCETTRPKGLSSLSSGTLLSGEGASSRAVIPSLSASGSDRSARVSNRVPVRLRTLSFRL